MSGRKLIFCAGGILTASSAGLVAYVGSLAPPAGETSVAQQVAAPTQPPALAATQPATQPPGQYRLLLFYRAQDENTQKAMAVMEQASKKWGRRIRTELIDVRDAANRELVARYPTRRLPLTLMLGPSGAVTVGYTGRPSLEALQRGFVSPAMEQVLGGIQKRKIVFLAVGTSSSSGYESIRNATDTAVSLLGDIAHAVYLDPADPSEKKLVQQCRLEPGMDAASVVVVSPRGTIADKFTGQVTTEQLLGSFEKILTQRSGCSNPTVTGGSACNPRRGVAKRRGGCN